MLKGVKGRLILTEAFQTRDKEMVVAVLDAFSDHLEKDEVDLCGLYLVLIWSLRHTLLFSVVIASSLRAMFVCQPGRLYLLTFITTTLLRKCSRSCAFQRALDG